MFNDPVKSLDMLRQLEDSPPLSTLMYCLCFRLRAAHGLFSALENCTDIVQITDNKHQVGGERERVGVVLQSRNYR